MTHNMRSAFVVSASTGVAILGAILPAAIISVGPATAAEARGRALSTTAEMQQVIYSPWAKFCGRGALGGREVCFTGKDARTNDGQTVMAAALIEPEGRPKFLRVTLPGSPQSRSARITIDKEPSISSAVTCFANRCKADYEGTPELLDKLKKGQMLQIQVVSLVPMIPFQLPLADSSGNSFAGANEGPPTDPKVFHEQQQKKRCPLCKPLALMSHS
jgi:invasion protein IalB